MPDVVALGKGSICLRRRSKDDVANGVSIGLALRFLLHRYGRGKGRRAARERLRANIVEHAAAGVLLVRHEDMKTGGFDFGPGEPRIFFDGVSAKLDEDGASFVGRGGFGFNRLRGGRTLGRGRAGRCRVDLCRGRHRLWRQ